MGSAKGYTSTVQQFPCEMFSSNVKLPFARMYAYTAGNGLVVQSDRLPALQIPLKSCLARKPPETLCSRYQGGQMFPQTHILDDPTRIWAI